jgi:hypothetical protein
MASSSAFKAADARREVLKEGMLRLLLMVVLAFEAVRFVRFASNLPAKRGGKALIPPELACMRVSSS